MQSLSWVAAGLPASGSAEGDQGFSLRLKTLKRNKLRKLKFAATKKNTYAETSGF